MTSFPEIPDADYIREAERYGMPSPEPVKSPLCGAECGTIYLDRSRGYDVVGCDKCIKVKDAWDRAEEVNEKENEP